MNLIEVTKKKEDTFEVVVNAAQTTRHVVTVEPSYCERLTGGNSTAEELLEMSFEFLLEREPNTMILSSFDLPVIGHYFPEYEKSIRTRCSRG